MTPHQATGFRLHIFSAEKAMIQTFDCYKYKRWSKKHGLHAWKMKKFQAKMKVMNISHHIKT